MSNSENVLVTANDHFEVVEKTTVIDDSWPTHNQAIEDQILDHFICRDGKTSAGTHLIADFWGASHLDDLSRMEKALREAVEKAKERYYIFICTTLHPMAAFQVWRYWLSPISVCTVGLSVTMRRLMCLCVVTPSQPKRLKY